MTSPENADLSVRARTGANTGGTPEGFAYLVKAGETELLQRAIDAGVDVNWQDESGMTPLHHAVAYGTRPCLRLLVHSGRCDYLIRDNMGRYASDIAIEWARDFAVARLLSKHQARQAVARGVLPFQTD